MQKAHTVDLKNYLYELPEDKIAFEATSKRDNSKLLHYSEGIINDHHFNEITNLIPSNSTLIFNNTKVIPARLFLQKKTGATIEIFLLKPANNIEISRSLESTKKATWECMVGNLKKWNEDEVLSATISVNSNDISLNATLINKNEKIVEFRWDGKELSFAQLIDALGNTPLPPYIKRDLVEDDKTRYQTVYSKVDGAVAAPTAGLHFTQEILSNLAIKGVKQSQLTLHVGAGTFMPIKSDSVEEHPMHNETMVIPLEIINSILDAEFTITVGTTSMRTLESLYWFGVRLMENPEAEFKIDKLYPYKERNYLPSKKQAFTAIKTYVQNQGISVLHGSTEIFIFPGYQFMVCDGLITNFHQPESTLILLVAAFIGKDWRSIYSHALKNDYRFLSFGDSSLLIPAKEKQI